MLFITHDLQMAAAADRVIEMIAANRIDPRPLVTRVFSFDELSQAIAAAAGDGVIKVQIEG